MDYKSILINLFHLLISADEDVSEKELLRGKQMMEAEGISDHRFNDQINKLKTKDSAILLKETTVSLKKLEAEKQLRSIAWLCVIANSDGFMDKREWMLIYKLYHTELNLKLDDVMKVQKELNKIIHGKAFTSYGVWVKKPDEKPSQKI